MKILYINVIELNKGWGAEYFLNKAFLKSGAGTITLDYRKHRGHISKKLLEIKDDFDALLIQRGDDFPVELLKAVNRPRFFSATELVTRRKDQDQLFDSLLFDHIFVRGENCRDVLLARGVLKPEQVSVLLSAFDTEVFYPDQEIKKDIDILFIGALKDRRKKILSELKKDFNIIVASAFGGEMAKFLNRAKIVLNIHAEEHIDTETRVFETLGCRAFLITEKLGRESPFLNGAHLVEVEGMEEMKEKIAFYLQSESARTSIAHEGFEEAIKKHTYQKRAEELLALINTHLKQGEQNVLPALDRQKIEQYIYQEQINFLKDRFKDVYIRIKNSFLPI
ncbi:MAG: glycosyltransferase family 1 protein [Parcubacteria group bacterium]|nr:glycosyltransferase family 1 protein [Parcubacteria group bacterium]